MTVKVRILWPSLGRSRPKPMFLSVVPQPDRVPLLAQAWETAQAPTPRAVPEPASMPAPIAFQAQEPTLAEEPDLAHMPPAVQAPTPDSFPEPSFVSVPGPILAPVAVPAPTAAFSTFIDEENEKQPGEAKETSVRQIPPPAKASSRPFGPGIIQKTFSWLRKNYTPTARKALRISETVNLGEKRFVAIIHADGRKFLIGGGSSGVALLTQLGNQPDAADPHLSIHELTERSA